MNSELLTLSLEQGVMYLALNRPAALNSLNTELLASLNAAFVQAQRDPAIKVVVLTGAGKGFCAGADLKELKDLDPKDAKAFAKRGQAAFDLLQGLGKPSIALIHGFALGGGCELAMAATLRIASPTASLGQPEIKLGIIPGFGGTQRLTRLVGLGRALELCLTGRLIKAPEALSYGLIQEVVAEDGLLKRAKLLATQLAQMPPHAVKAILTSIYAGSDLELEAGLDLEAEHFAVCANTQDKIEGVAAFLEKRLPHFSGS